MKYQLTEIPPEDFYSLLAKLYPDRPQEQVKRLSNAAAAIFNSVLWCEIHGMPIGYLEMLELVEQKTSLSGDRLFIAAAAATKAANLALCDQLQL